MRFVGVHFDEECDGGIALVCSRWLTPRKTHVFWPPYKTQDAFRKALKNNEVPKEETWQLYSIQRIFFENDDLQKGLEKIKKAEESSNFESEDELLSKQRRQVKKRKLFESDSEEEDVFKSPNYLIRPPQPKKRTESEDNSLTETTPCSSTYINTLNSVSSDLPWSSTISLRESDTILKELQYIKEQNNLILSWIRNQIHLPGISVGNLQNFPVEFPLSTLEDVEKLESHLNISHDHVTALVNNISGIGGRDGQSMTNNILRKLLKNEVATSFSFKGSRNGKRAFQNLTLKTVIIDAVRKRNCAETEINIENQIKIWLKHSPQRLKLELYKKA